MLGLIQAHEGELCNIAFPMCICRLTLAWISSEISTKLLGMPLPSLLWTLSHANWSLCCPVSTGHSRHPSPTPSSQSLCLTLWLAFPSYFRSRRDLESKPFVWFRAKTDKGIVCLADHLHSVTQAHVDLSVLPLLDGIIMEKLILCFLMLWKYF